MQTANVVGTLVEKTGLPVPLSYLYKKFSIPEPEDGEAIATPSYAQQAAGPVLPFKAQPRRYVALKGGGPGTQEHIDRVTAAALKRGAKSWRKAFAPGTGGEPGAAPGHPGGRGRRGGAVCFHGRV